MPEPPREGAFERLGADPPNHAVRAGLEPHAAADAGDPPKIGPASEAERGEAIARIAGRLSPLRGFIEARFTAPSEQPPWLWVLRSRDGKIEAAALALCNPGRTATLIPPSRASPRSSAAWAEVVEAMTRAMLLGGEADLVQAMVPPAEIAIRKTLETAGLQTLASLRFMDRPPAPARPSPLPAGLAFAPWDPALRGEVERLLSRTFEQTLDCPELAGVRRPADLLAGHEAASGPEPRRWRFLRDLERGELAGMALLNSIRHNAHDELAYFGLVPEARGRGLASLLLQESLAHASGSQRVVLAVDERNLPALRLYRKNGFVPGGTRLALIRTRAAVEAA